MFDSPVMFFSNWAICLFRPSRNDASALHCVHGCITSSFRLEDGIGIRASLDALEDSNHLSQGILEWWENDGIFGWRISWGLMELKGTYKILQVNGLNSPQLVGK